MRNMREECGDCFPGWFESWGRLSFVGFASLKFSFKLQLQLRRELLPESNAPHCGVIRL